MLRPADREANARRSAGSGGLDADGKLLRRDGEHQRDRLYPLFALRPGCSHGARWGARHDYTAQRRSDTTVSSSFLPFLTGFLTSILRIQYAVSHARGILSGGYAVVNHWGRPQFVKNQTKAPALPGVPFCSSLSVSTEHEPTHGPKSLSVKNPRAQPFCRRVRPNYSE